MSKVKPDIIKYGYCVHMATGKDLGDMCEDCCYHYYKSWQFKLRSVKFDFILLGIRIKRIFKPYKSTET